MRLNLLIAATLILGLNACGQPEITEDTSKNSLVPQSRMNFLVGRSIIRRKATPLQMGETCQTVSDVRKYTKACRPAINEMAKRSNFKDFTCETKELKIRDTENYSSGVVCEGLLETKIGSGLVTVSFQKSEEKWIAKDVKIVNDTWTKKT